MTQQFDSSGLILVHWGSSFLEQSLQQVEVYDAVRVVEII